MRVAEKVERQIRSLPERPGIYVFLGEKRETLYVGKARSLRSRASSYLSGEHEPRLVAMLTAARAVEFVVTDTEAEALLLENNWIKKRSPRFNILLRDDKTYPYLKLTNEPYPLVAFTRRLGDRRAEYFGPYIPAGLARKGIKLVQKLFQIRVCTIEIDGSLPRPCLYYDMKRCLGPCVDGLTSPHEYGQAVRAARLFLSGRTDELARRLRRQMTEASQALEFEKAAELRDIIAEIEEVGQKRKLSSLRGEDVDVFGIRVAGGTATVFVLVMRGGQVLDRREIFWEGAQDVTADTVLAELLPQIYEQTTFVPKEIHLPLPVEGLEALADWLGKRKGEKVYVRLPARGAKAQRVKLADRNAALAHRRRFRGQREHAALSALRDELGLDELPRRIEGFDISNFQGGEIVASMVVCEDGAMRKSEYRSFNIRGLVGQDDLAAMRQAVSRRYRRRLEEVGEMPDLILVDGGRGQLNAALSALAELEVEETPCAALAKRHEEVYLVDRPQPLRLEQSHAGLQLLQRIRDEAHRFAVARHRKRRRKLALRSSLESVPGVGPKRRRLLLTHFGSLEGVRTASEAELQGLLGAKLGRRLFRQLQAADESRISQRTGNGPG